jgi:hypothetical protein
MLDYAQAAKAAGDTAGAQRYMQKSQLLETKENLKKLQELPAAKKTAEQRRSEDRDRL